MTQGEVFQCIYCLEWKAAGDFDREHVLPEAFGLYATNSPVLHLAVCVACNRHFGRTLDLVPLTNFPTDAHGDRATAYMTRGLAKWKHDREAAMADLTSALECAADPELQAQVRQLRASVSLTTIEGLAHLESWSQPRRMN